VNRPTGYTSAEFDKAADRRISWTAFYRRVAYDDVRPGLLPASTYDGPRAPQGNGDDIYYPADRQLYEFIVIVTRKPSTRHQFARQDVSNVNIAAYEKPRALAAPASNDTRGGDRVAPMPWLVVSYLDPTFPADYDGTSNGPFDPYDGIMQGLERRAGNTNTTRDSFDDTSIARPLSRIFAERSTLKFRVRPEVGRLLAPGSVMIPATNDNFPHDRPAAPRPTNFATPAHRTAGFVPLVPDSLPIYEVLEVLPDDPSVGANRGTTIVVKNNGAYPWVSVGPPANNNAAYFPFWVIPPAFVERDPNDQPVFEKISPIIGVYRKVIRIPEIH